MQEDYHFLEHNLNSALSLHQIISFDIPLSRNRVHTFLNRVRLVITYSIEYHLSPAYDLINTSLHIYEPRIFALEKGLFKEGMQLSDTKNISDSDFKELGHRIGLPQKLIIHELKRFSEPNEMADALIGRSYLSAELKRAYLKGYHYRQSMIRQE